MALISESLNVLVTFLTFNVIPHSGHEKTALLLGIASNVLFGEGGGGGGGGGGVTLGWKSEMQQSQQQQQQQRQQQRQQQHP